MQDDAGQALAVGQQLGSGVQAKNLIPALVHRRRHVVLRLGRANRKVADQVECFVGCRVLLPLENSSGT